MANNILIDKKEFFELLIDLIKSYGDISPEETVEILSDYLLSEWDLCLPDDLYQAISSNSNRQQLVSIVLNNAQPIEY